MLVLGIDWNLEQQTVRLPADKLAALKGPSTPGLVKDGVRGSSWNRSSAIFTVLLELCGQNAPSCDA